MSKEFIDREKWEVIRNWCTQDFRRTCGLLKQYGITADKKTIGSVTITDAIKHFNLKMHPYELLGIFSTLRALQRAENLGLTPAEYSNPKIRKAAKNGQKDLFLSQNS